MPSDLADRLADACAGQVRPAEEADDVAGVAPVAVASPDSTEQVAATLREASALGLTVVVRGCGTRLGWGAAPSTVDLVLDLSRMNRVLEHEAGDLIATAQAGTRLDALRSTLAERDQQLAIDPAPAPGADHPGSVGGTIATAVSGPLRLSHGAVRDLLIGVTFVRADGTIARAGGKVVKNVAGYDLGKLLAGSWGTLGVIAEATFRLHPIAPVTRWVSIAVPDTAAAHRQVQQVVHSQLVATAVELDRPADGTASLAVQVSGTESGVEARVALLLDALGAGEVADAAPAWWAQLPWTPNGVGLRLTHELTGLPHLLAALDDACAAAGTTAAVRGSAGVGLLHAGLPGDDPARVAQVVDTLRSRRAAWAGDVVVLDAPAAVRAAVDPWGDVAGLALMRRIKDQFDPGHLLAPGRFVGGI